MRGPGRGFLGNASLRLTSWRGWCRVVGGCRASWLHPADKFQGHLQLEVGIRFAAIEGGPISGRLVGDGAGDGGKGRGWGKRCRLLARGVCEGVDQVSFAQGGEFIVWCRGVVYRDVGSNTITLDGLA